MKYLLMTAILGTLLAQVGCGSSSMQQMNMAQENRVTCTSAIQADEELQAAKEFLGNNQPTPSMMVDTRYPSVQDKQVMARWMDIEVRCSRAMIEEASQIDGVTSDPFWPNLLSLTTEVEDLYVGLLSGNMTYGDYFSERRDLYSEAKRLEAAADRSTAVALQQQQAAQAQAWSNAFSNAQKSFQNQPSIGNAFDKDKSQIDCTSWKVGNSVQTTCR